MKIALPVENGAVCQHFGHAPQFALVEIENGAVARHEIQSPPPGKHCGLAHWLGENGVTHVLCGGIGGGAIQLLQTSGIAVEAGLPTMDPAQAVEGFLAGTLKGGQMATCSCNHGGESHCGG